MERKEIKLQGNLMRDDIFKIADKMVALFAKESANYNSLVITYQNPINRITVKCDSLKTTAKEITSAYSKAGLELLARRS